MSNENRNSKRHKEVSLADDLICPITLQLPFNPVTAEDGRIYERWAIEEHFKSSNGTIKSPITKQVIGTKLFPAHQHKNHIVLLLEKGLISGDLADKWNEKVKEKKGMEELLQKAESGDVEAMVKLGHNYTIGRNGFSRNMEKAFLWYDRAREAGSVQGTARVGEFLTKGVGGEKDCHKGFMYLGVAAAQGSYLAALVLASAFAYGKYGAKVDRSLAIHWLEKVTSGECPIKDLPQETLQMANDMFNDLKGQD